MKKVLIKLGKQFYEMDPLSLKLTPVDTPENIETLEFFDGTKIAAYVDSSYDGTNTSTEAVDKFNEKVIAFNTARKAASTKEEQDAVDELKPELAVFKHGIAEKKASAARLEVEIEEEKTEPETPKEEEKEGTVETPERTSETVETPAETPTEGTPAAPTETPDQEPAGDPKLITDDDVNKLLDSENIKDVEELKEAVTAGMQIIKGSQKAITAGGAPQFVQVREPELVSKGFFDNPLERKTAEFVVASAGLQPGQKLAGNSEEFWDYLTAAWNNAFFSGNNEGRQSAPLGSFLDHRGELFDDVKEFDPRSQGIAITASGEVCDVEYRDTLLNCTNLGNDLTGLFRTFATQACEVEYYEDISQWDLAGGITYWSTKRYQDYCAARDELNAALQEGAELPAIAALQAKVATLQKKCADIGCLKKKRTNPLEDISACLNYSKRQEQCSQREIQIHLEYLERMFQKAKNAYVMKFIDDCSVTVNVDACIFGGLDACHVVDEVVGNMTTKTNEKEGYAPEGGWIGISEDRFLQYLSTGPRKGGSYLNGNSGFNKTSIEGLRNLVTTYDNYAQPVDPNDPDSPIDLIPHPDDNPDLYNSDYPEAGTTINYGEDCQYPTSWTLYVLDPDDAFAMRKPDTSLNAAFTHESSKGNWVNGPFMESTMSLNKNGCKPWYKFVFTNLENTGARYANVPALSNCGVEEAPEAP